MVCWPLYITDRDGDVIWSHKTAGPKQGHTGHHDVHLLPNGNILYHDSWTKLTEMTLGKKVVWTYDSASMNGNKGKRVDVHAFARLKNGNTSIVESGVGRIIEVDKNGKIVDKKHPDFVRCKTEPVIGSRARKRRVCLTNRQWAEVESQGKGIARGMVEDSSTGILTN